MTSFEILTFWFGEFNEEGYGKPRQFWFVKDESFDQKVQSRFQEIYEQAAAGKLDYWRESPLSCLALIIILDQFPRNLFRNQPQAFATDEQALKLSQYAINKGFDKQLLPVQRWFIYLPLEHSENLDHQNQSVELFLTLKEDVNSLNTIEYARHHREIIERFGRFPHRNSILGRISTPEEIEFLKQPGSSF